MGGGGRCNLGGLCFYFILLFYLVSLHFHWYSYFPRAARRYEIHSIFTFATNLFSCTLTIEPEQVKKKMMSNYGI